MFLPVSGSVASQLNSFGRLFVSWLLLTSLLFIVLKLRSVCSLSPGGLLLLFAFQFLTGRAIAQQQAPAWRAAFAVGASYSSAVYAVATDSVGNVYLAGNFANTARFGALTLTSAGNTDGFVAKWAPATNTFVWAQRWGGAGQDEVYAIAVRGAAVYLTGMATGFGVRVGTLPVIDCSGSDAVVLKLVDAGSTSRFVWAFQSNGPRDESGRSIVATAAGVYVAGNSNSGYVRFAPFTAFFDSPFQGGFVVKLVDAGSSASPAWLQQVSGTREAFLNTLTVAPGGVLYVGGDTSSPSVPFGAFSLPNLSGPTASYSFVAKLQDQGSSSNWVWAQGIGGRGTTPGRVYLKTVRVAGNAVYATGAFEGASVTLGSLTLTTYPGAVGSQRRDIFLAKLTDAGASAAFAWAMPVGGTGVDSPGDLLVDGTTLYLSGAFDNTVAFGGTALSSAGFSDAFVSRLTDTGSTGRFEWAQRGGGAGLDFASVLARKDSTLYTGGNFAGFVGNSATFGPYVLASSAGSTGNANGFVAALGTTGRSLATAVRPATGAAVALYPNPARQAVTVVLPVTAQALGAEVVVLNGLGQAVRQATLAPRVQQTELGLAQLPAGVYTVRVSSGEQVLAARLVVL